VGPEAAHDVSPADGQRSRLSEAAPGEAPSLRSPAGLAALQRAVGNRAVGRVLARDSATSTGKSTGSSTPPPKDAGPADAGPVDAGPVDAGPTDAGPADAGPVVVDPAAANAVIVRDYIKATAQARAKTAKSVDKKSKFYKRLTDYYLKDYLKAPTAAAGKVAAETARKFRPALPAELAAATDILSKPNRKVLPYIDVPQLVGKANMGTGADADVAGGGKNISQLMHWATGVKYSDIDKQTMRELFLAYELWHLEAWDVFGEDPINDLIAEESGRILGVGLRAGAITSANLQDKLNEAFGEARAWVGSLLRARQAEFDAWIVAETQKKANMWWGALSPMDIWGSETIYSKLKAGQTVDVVEKSDLVERITDIYTLIYEAGEWETAHGKIDNGDFIEMMLAGKLNKVFEKMAKGQPVTTIDVVGGN
jgi:hypothetical protein